MSSSFSSADRSRDTSVRRTAAIAGIVAALAALAGLGARATYAARTSGDEPYYLLTAVSVAEDGSLDIADDLAARRYLPYHEIPIDPQTTALGADGRRLAPHDPALPLLLAPAAAVAGWAGAKGVLVLLAGLTAAATAAVAAGPAGVRSSTSLLVAAGAGAGVPLAPYGTQVYPEVVAALAVVVAVGTTAVALQRPGARLARAAPWVVGVAVVLLPWLSVKYVPVAVAVAAVAAGVLLRHGRRRAVVWGAAALAVCAVGYVAAHQVLYGGWTVYAAGDHFVEAGELSVVGTAPNPMGRLRRLTGLLVDRGFGIGVWAPLWLAGPAAVAVLLRTRHPLRWLLLAPLAAGWFTASLVALTMHGWWVAGRQIVVVLPLLAVVIGLLVERLPALRPLIAGAAAAGVVTWLQVAWEASTGRRALIVDMDATTAPLYRVVAALAPDGRLAEDAGLALWSALLAASAFAAVAAVDRAADGAHRAVGVRRAGP